MNEDDLRMLTEDELKSFIPQLIPLKKLRTYLNNNGPISPSATTATPSSSITPTATSFSSSLLVSNSHIPVAPDVMTFGECKATLVPVTGRYLYIYLISTSLHSNRHDIGPEWYSLRKTVAGHINPANEVTYIPFLDNGCIDVNFSLLFDIIQ
jgi:hypothetical protein